MTTTTKKMLLGAGLLLALMAVALIPKAWPLVPALLFGMATINENSRISDVLMFEEGEEVNFVRDAVTLISGTPASKIGQVLGQITIGGATAAAKQGGNTGNGTLVMDGTTPILANAQVGIYTVTCTVAGTNSATFRVVDPIGRVLGDAAFSGSGASATFADQIKFAITDGATDFVVGDGFTVTIAAGSGKYAQVAPAAVDGTAVAAGVLLAAVDASAADAVGVAVVRGPAVLKTSGVVWTAGMTTNQKTAALAQLAALRILNRQDYGA